MRIGKNELFRCKNRIFFYFKLTSCLNGVFEGGLDCQGTLFLRRSKGWKSKTEVGKKNFSHNREGENGRPNFNNVIVDYLGIHRNEQNGKVQQKVLIGEMLKNALLHVKGNKRGNQNGTSHNTEGVVERILNNKLMMENLNIIHFNMLLTIISKGEITLSKKMQDSIMHLLHRHIFFYRNDIDNTNNAWINIIHILSNICKNNKTMLCLIRKRGYYYLGSEKTQENTSLSFVDKFVHRICKPNDWNYSIREISLLLHSCYYLNIRSYLLFDTIFEKLQKNEYHFNCLDTHIFVYAVYKLQLQKYVPFLEKLKKKILKNICYFSSGQLVNILLAYTHVYYKDKNKKFHLKKDLFINNIFENCWNMINNYSNREFCNFLNFIVQNDINLNHEQRSEIFIIIYYLLKNKECKRLKLKLMIDLDIFTILNFVYKYGNLDNTITYITKFSISNINDLIIQLIKKKKFKQNLLVYILHFYKQSVANLHPISNHTVLHFIQHICAHTLEFKMKVILLTSLERHVTVVGDNHTEDTHNFSINKYYCNLMKYIYNDICKGENVLICEKKKENILNPNGCPEGVVISSTDIKEILKLIKKRTQNSYYNSEQSGNLSHTVSLEKETLKVQQMLLNVASDYVTKNKIVELFPLILMNRNVPTDICNKAESIIYNIFDNLNQHLLDLKNGVNMKNKYEKNKTTFNFFHSLNLCNECIFSNTCISGGGGNMQKFKNNKNAILQCIELIPMNEENKKYYFQLHVHMLLFDINNNLPFFINHLLRKISDFLVMINSNYKQYIVNFVDIYSSIIKVHTSYYEIYIEKVYKYMYPQIFSHYENLNCKHLCLLFYSNLIHLFLHIYDRKKYSNHVTLSIRLMLKLFSYFLNSMDEGTYNLIQTNSIEISEYHKRDKNIKITPSLNIPVNDLIYLYRVLTIFHFTNLYAYMNVYELKCLFVFHQILNFNIFKVNNFSVTEFIQTHKGKRGRPLRGLVPIELTKERAFT
ncbi:hypothetical protein, conserved [Plasmodium gonderi]|uniref:Uncharacterized protein n=1 Tax=Plasmodium gonderi TaxID=77519 RepID=A0A1Y1JIY5_PLAGO|nr:hypothetical protein, conserved [Plasmodium gonderi]GAW81325.1 hypothetical protein, conserved [Plasmodium gonderi]